VSYFCNSVYFFDENTATYNKFKMFLLCRIFLAKEAVFKVSIKNDDD